MMKLDSAKPGTSKRNFILNSDGELQVFHDGGGNKDAAQITSLLTKGGNPRILGQQGSVVTVMMGNGKKMEFDTRTALPVSMEGCDLTVSPQSSMTDPGFHVKSCQHAIAKTAYGYDPKVRGKKLKLISPLNKVCEIDSTEIFNVKKNDAALRFGSNSQFRSGLENIVKNNSACQGLGFDFSFVKDFSAPAKAEPAPSADPLGDLIREKTSGAQ